MHLIPANDRFEICAWCAIEVQFTVCGDWGIQLGIQMHASCLLSSQWSRVKWVAQLTWGIAFVIDALAWWTMDGVKWVVCICVCVRVCMCLCVLTLRRPDRLVLCQQMEACIIQSGGSFMLFLFLSHHCSQRQTKQDLATEDKRRLHVALAQWPSSRLVPPPPPHSKITHKRNSHIGTIVYENMDTYLPHRCYYL